MRFVEEDAEFGIMNWRLLSREPDKKLAVYVLPIGGLGTYMRTVVDGVWEEPILIKNSLIIELVIRDGGGTGLVDVNGQAMAEPVYKCLNRELVTLELAKKRFTHKGKPLSPGLELYSGSVLTQEQRPMVMPVDAMKEVDEARAEEAVS